MCLATSATQVGIIVQLVGGGWLVFQSSKTAKSLSNFKAQLTYDKIQETLELLAKEVASNFQQQLVGFIFLVAGSALQLYGTTPCS
jgi:hypothetical protein